MHRSFGPRVSIDASSTKTLSAPLLQKSRRINARSGNELQRSTASGIVAHLSADSATSFSPPLLEESGDINANRTMSFSAPLLQKSGDINAEARRASARRCFGNRGGRQRRMGIPVKVNIDSGGKPNGVPE